MLAPAGQYYNYSGCGNTVNANHPAVTRFVVDCLRYWVQEMHIDGFRFDLASILTRAHSLWHGSTRLAGGGVGAPLCGSGGPALGDGGAMTDGAGLPTGTPLADPPLVQAIANDPVLRNTKLIAEAWDADGLNQVGAFPHHGGRWAEWNGPFRDAVRAFIKGTDGPWAAAFASALCGSPNIFAADPGDDDWWGSGDGRRWRGGRSPAHSINFVTAHDGFTLADLVAYNDKQNEANGEGGRDGESHNLSWNCGVEGATDDATVLRLRARQVRNLAAALLLAHGVPMLHMGDEYGHSKAKEEGLGGGTGGGLGGWTGGGRQEARGRARTAGRCARTRAPSPPHPAHPPAATPRAATTTHTATTRPSTGWTGTPRPPTLRDTGAGCRRWCACASAAPS